MKFIFPRNFNFKNKFLGIIEYSTLFINLLWDVFIFCLVNLVLHSLTMKITIFIILCFPLLLFSIVNCNNENILIIISYLIKFLFSPKIYLFNK